MRTSLDPDQALALVLEQASPLPPEPVPFAQALGRCLGEAVVADRDYPPFDRSMMDGYAVRVEDAGRRVIVGEEIAAGMLAAEAVIAGRCAAIMTGAPCPPGTEAVVPREEVQLREDGVLLPEGLRPGQHVSRQGEECRQGETVLQPGNRLSPLALGVLAAVGRQEVRVVARPSVAVITTGDEVVATSATPTPAQIRDVNGPLLVALASGTGVGEVTALHARDEAAALAAVLDRATRHDVIILAGGVSVGNYDLVPEAVTAFGAAILFHGVRQKPGKPLLFARRDRQLIFGLPGNPLSVHLCYHRYVAAAIRRLSGLPQTLATRRGRLQARLRAASDRTLFALARADRWDEGWRVSPGTNKGSADIFASAQANAFVRLPPGRHDLGPGEEVSFELFGDR